MFFYVGVGEFCEIKKVYFFGYIIYWLLFCVIGGVEDDCDYYGNKWLDFVGFFFGGFFWMFF